MKCLYTQLHQESKGTDISKAVNSQYQCTADENRNSQYQRTADENRRRLIPIIKTIAFCGQNNLALRGNDDSGPLNLNTIDPGEGNFRRLLKFRIDAGDLDLRDHITNAPRDACYTSAEIQNDIIQCIEAQLKDKVIARVQQNGFYCILADETTDISGVEQLSLCVRYYDCELCSVREDFIAFIDVLDKQYSSEQEFTDSDENELQGADDTFSPVTLDDYFSYCDGVTAEVVSGVEPKPTGEVIGKTILHHLDECNLSFNAAVAQGYDGAQVMSSNSVGTSATIKHSCQYADYYHCSAHALNLCLVHASKHPSLRNMIGIVKEVTSVFSGSNKKQIVLQKSMQQSTSVSGRVTLPGLSETRWVERITSLENFVACYIPIVRALMAVHRWGDQAASVKASTLLKSVTSTSFLVALFTAVSLCLNIDSLSKTLQSKQSDMKSAMDSVENILETLQQMRATADATLWYSSGSRIPSLH